MKVRDCRDNIDRAIDEIMEVALLLADEEYDPRELQRRLFNARGFLDCVALDLRVADGPQQEV